VIFCTATWLILTPCFAMRAAMARGDLPERRCAASERTRRYFRLRAQAHSANRGASHASTASQVHFGRW
jgi:hypothetical protein